MVLAGRHSIDLHAQIIPGRLAGSYHKDLEPFIARGRELLAQKVTGAKRKPRFASRTGSSLCRGSRGCIMY